MEIKKWQEYDYSLKQELLYYWWNEYKRRWSVYEVELNERFGQIVDMDIDLVYAMIVMLWQSHVLSYGLIDIMKQGSGKLCWILNKTLEFRTSGEKSGYFERVSNEFLKELVTDFNKQYSNKQNIETDEGFGSL